MLWLNTYFDEKGELSGVVIIPYGSAWDHPSRLQAHETFATECPDMQTALTVAAAWQRTGRKR